MFMKGANIAWADAVLLHVLVQEWQYACRSRLHKTSNSAFEYRQATKRTISVVRGLTEGNSFGFFFFFTNCKNVSSFTFIKADKLIITCH